jgi:ABC-type polysaccharide/polyol phosphate export permease
MASSVREVWDYRALVANLARRQLKSEYKRDFLGAAWSLLNPLLNLAILSLVFGTILKFGADIPDLGDRGSGVFALFLFAGLIPFTMWRRITVGSIASLKGASALLRKVYFPPDVSLIAYTLVQARQAVFEGFILAGIIVLLGQWSWTIMLWPLLLPFVAMFSLGLGYMLALLATYYADVQYLVEHFMQLMFYLTPIIFSVSRFEPPNTEPTVFGVGIITLLNLNPLTSFVGVSRALIYEQQMPDLTQLLIVLIISPVTLFIGFNVFRVFGRDVAEEL